MGEKARPILDDVKKGRGGGYVDRMVPYVIQRITGKPPTADRTK